MYAVQNAQISNQPNFGCLKSNKKIVDLMKLKRARGVYEEEIKMNAAHSVKSNLFSVLKDAIIETNAVLVQFTKEFFSALKFKPKNTIDPFSSNRLKTPKN